MWARRSSWPRRPSSSGCAHPDRDTVLYPAVSYPTYAMGATLAGARAVPVPELGGGGPDLSSIDRDDAARALVLWVNSPANPTGAAHRPGSGGGLGAGPRRAGASPTSATPSSPGTARRGASSSRERRAWSPSTRCPSARTWPGCGPASTPATPTWSATCSTSAATPGSWCPARCRPGAVVALDDDVHVDEQRERYREAPGVPGRRSSPVPGLPVDPPAGGFYLWVPVPGTVRRRMGAVRPTGRPGRAAGQPGGALRRGRRGHVRVAVVQPMDRLELVAERLAAVD